MERRMATVNFSAAGGTAGKGARTCKITLPGSRLAALGVDEAHRQIWSSYSMERRSRKSWRACSLTAPRLDYQPGALLNKKCK